MFYYSGWGKQVTAQLNDANSLCVSHRHTWPEPPGRRHSSGALVATPAGSRGCWTYWGEGTPSLTGKHTTVVTCKTRQGVTDAQSALRSDGAVEPKPCNHNERWPFNVARKSRRNRLSACRERVLTSLIIFTASRVRPSFLEHMASLLFIYTNTLVSLPGGETHTSRNMSSLLGDACHCAAGALTVLGFVLCSVMLQLLAAAIAALSGF